MQDIFRSQFRLPVALAEKLRASSETSGRSMNAEVVARLEQSFSNGGSPPAGIWPVFFELVRIQSRIETSAEMTRSLLKQSNDLLQRKFELLRDGAEPAEIASHDEALHVAQDMISRMDEGFDGLRAERVALEDRLGTMIEGALKTS